MVRGAVESDRRDDVQEKERRGSTLGYAVIHTFPCCHAVQST